MKIRNGFVSNSSSSSYVIAVKPDFDWKNSKYATADYWRDNDACCDMEDDKELKQFAKDFIKQVKSMGGKKGGGMWNEDEMYYPFCEAMDDLEKDGAILVVACLNGGPDDGSVSALSAKELAAVKAF